ncbi:MAG: hypothetical protein ACLFSI_02655 [Halorhodospira sp.]
MPWQIYERDGLVRGYIYGPQQNGSEPAPEDFSPDNAKEWIKKDGEWVHDPEAAEEKRKELEG